MLVALQAAAAVLVVGLPPLLMTMMLPLLVALQAALLAELLVDLALVGASLALAPDRADQMTADCRRVRASPRPASPPLVLPLLLPLVLLRLMPSPIPMRSPVPVPPLLGRS